MPKKIAVLNQKGGTSKTVTSINLSSGLALEGHKVLLVDLDPQANSTLGLGIESGSYGASIHNVLLQEKNPQEAVLETKVANLSLIPSHFRLSRAEDQLASGLSSQALLYKALEGLDYDFIIIDCRPTLGTLTLNAVYASDFIIVPCDMGSFSLEGFSDLLDTVDTVKDRASKNKKNFMRILLTRFETRNKVTNEWILNQLEPYKKLLFKTKIRKNEALNQATMAKEPIFVFQPRSNGAEDYKQLTQEFLGLCQT